VTKEGLGATKRWARDELIVNPQPETVLKEGDLLVLSGSEPKINRALYYLESPYEGMY
jgi:K+/H+ antiporter YhaU regulatory subunit KhtT